MFRSVKSQIIAATSIIIIAILGGAAYLVIDQKIKEINQDIFTRAVSFAELTHERVVSNYEDNYLQSATAFFERELAEIYSMNEDIIGLCIHDYTGETLYMDDSIRDLVDEKVAEDMERIQAIYPSVKTKSGRVVYLQMDGEEIRYTNLNGDAVEPIKNTEQIEDIYYPFRDQNDITRSYSLHYLVSYDSLAQRVQETVIRILIIAVAGILLALLIGSFVAHRITSPIKTLTKGAEQIGHGDLKTRVKVKSKSEVGKLANTFNKMASDLEKSTEELVEKEKMTRELELASEIQQELLPTKLPSIKNLDIAASLNAATQVGGDCYDFIALEKDEKLLFYIADVTGHGVGAGLVSAINNALVPALLDHTHDTQELVVELNKLLIQKTAPNVFVTLVMNMWDPKKDTLSFTQAGHDPILHFKAKDEEVVELPKGGNPLGLLPDISKNVKTESVKAEKGDVFVLYTDGIPEAWKNDEETYGMDRLKESVKKHSKLKTAQEIHDAILKDVRDFMGKRPQEDDITLLVIKRNQ
jgi:sigma-B regulation protein RsbU (phosphoserine phosphatase)